MHYFPLLCLALTVSFLLTPSQSLHIEINNIHHGYKTKVEGVSEIVQNGQGNTQIVLTNIKWQMDQLEPELIPFFTKITSAKASFALRDQMIQAVFDEEDQVILLVFKQNTSIITTITFKPHPERPDQNLSQVSEIIKKNCEWSQEAL